MNTRLMRARVLTIVALGAMIATTADAQATRTSTRAKRGRSSTRIPVNKEPVAPESTVTRDSTTAVAPAPAPPPAERAPVYTAPAAEPVATTPSPRLRMRHYGNGAYVGVGAGAGIPTGAIRNAYDAGFAVAVPIGWDAALNPFGFRIDLGYTRFGARSTFRDPFTVFPGAFLPVESAQLFSAIADAKLRIPFTRSWFPTSGVYAIAGGGLNHFRHYNTTFAISNPEFNGSITPTTTSESMTRLALNAGGGLWYAFRSTEVFVESRYVTTYMPFGRASYVPILLGVNVY